MKVELFDLINTALTICLQIAIAVIAMRILGMSFWLALLVGLTGGFLVVWAVWGAIAWFCGGRGADS